MIEWTGFRTRSEGTGFCIFLNVCFVSSRVRSFNFVRMRHYVDRWGNVKLTCTIYRLTACISEEIKTNRSQNSAFNEGADAQQRYSVLEDGTLMIENARDTDEGVYECMAKNQLGETKATAVELRYRDTANSPPGENCLIAEYSYCLLYIGEINRFMCTSGTAAYVSAVARYNMNDSASLYRGQWNFDYRWDNQHETSKKLPNLGIYPRQIRLIRYLWIASIDGRLADTRNA